jgi:hypothetical protein
MILKSNNKVKSIWRIINEEKGNTKRNKGIHSMIEKSSNQSVFSIDS